MKDPEAGKERLKRRLVKTYRRLNEREAKTAPPTTRHLQNMELVGQFTGSIAQYFNNVLTLIIGYGSFLQTKLNEQDPLQPYVHQILASSERAALLTRSLLTFSRKQVISPRPVSVNEVIRRASKLIQRILGEGIEFKAKLSNIELPVSADPVQLEQVLMNLATNARDAMPDGGTLTVEAKLVEVGSGSQGYEKFDTGWRCAVISFSDTGVGIDKELKDRIFEPFFTTKEPGKGTGLGLSIVYGIIRRHNGSISVVSEPGKGSTFCIYLPVVRNGTTVRSRIEAPAVAAEASNCYS